MRRTRSGWSSGKRCYPRNDDYSEKDHRALYLWNITQRYRGDRKQSKRGQTPKYCSNDCRHLARRTFDRIECQCDYCGKDIIAIDKNNINHYCSQECRIAHAKEQGTIITTCAHCGKEFILFDSRFHGYDAVIPERDNKYDNVEYSFKQIKWKNDEDGIATFSIKIDNDDSLEDFINNAYETDLETYSNSFGSIIINAKNVKTNTKKSIVNLETE